MLLSRAHCVDHKFHITTHGDWLSDIFAVQAECDVFHNPWEKNMTKSPTDHFVLLSENLPSATLIRKWLGLATLAVAFALCGVGAEAQQPKKVPRIGYLSNSDAATGSPRAEAIRLALRERGHIEGQNICRGNPMWLPVRRAGT